MKQISDHFICEYTRATSEGADYSNQSTNPNISATTSRIPRTSYVHIVNIMVVIELGEIGNRVESKVWALSLTYIICDIIVFGNEM